MAEMEMLLEQEIPSGRKALLESHNNLKNVASYCAQKYIESGDMKSSLDETKNFATQSLASVAYQINTLANNMLQLLDIQATQLSNMDMAIENISQTVSVHKEKVARREIGMLTTDKVFHKDKQIVPPAQPDRPVKYIRKPVDYSELDDIGHGIKVSDQSTNRVIRRPSAASNAKLSTANGISKQDSFRSNASTQGTLRPIKVPTVPDTKNLLHTRTNSNSSSGSGSQGLPAPAHGPPPPMSYTGDHHGMGMPTHKVKRQAPAPPASPSDGSGGYSTPIAANVMARQHPSGGIGGVETYATSSVLELPPPPPPPSNQFPSQLPGQNFATMQQGNVDPSSGYGMPPPSAFNLPPPPPPPDTMSMMSSVEESTGSGYQQEDWIPKNYIEKMIVIFDYSACNDDELDLREDQIIYVVKKNDDGWYEGVLDGVTGLFPSNYAQSASG